MAYRKLSAEFRCDGVRDERGKLVQFSAIISKWGWWDDVSVDLVRKFGAPRYVA